AAVIQEELEQLQVLGSQVAAQREIVAQAAVEILDHGAGADTAVGESGDGRLQPVQASPTAALQFGLPPPEARPLGVVGQVQQHGARQVGRDVVFAGQKLQAAVQLVGEGQ